MSLYDEFASAIMSLPGTELPLALDSVETVFLRAIRDHGPDTVFPRHIERGLPADRLFEVLRGCTLAEVGNVMSRLRHELADELARHGAPEDAVRELREGGSA
jgi:hypothetical protein